MRKIFGYHAFAKGTIIRLRAKLTYKESESLASLYPSFAFIRAEFKKDITFIEGYASDWDILRGFQADLHKAITKSKITYLAESIGYSNVELIEHLQEEQEWLDDLPF